jgi:hypothetical protein
MEAGETFAALAADLCAVLLDGARYGLEERVLAVNAALAGVLAAGAGLPVAPGKVGGDAGPFADADWPGLGSYERYWSVGGLDEPGPPVPVVMSDTLAFVFAELWRGLEHWQAGDAERAVGCWGLGYETTWGPAAAELSLALHPRVAAYRQDARSRTRPRARSARAPELAHVATREEPVVGVTRRDRPPEGAGGLRPLLGVRFEPSPAGVRVLDVHPAGPASGRLKPGDLVLAVDGVELTALEPDAARQRLVGPVGEVRRYEVLRGDERCQLEFASVGSIP